MIQTMNYIKTLTTFVTVELEHIFLTEKVQESVFPILLSSWLRLNLFFNSSEAQDDELGCPTLLMSRLRWKTFLNSKCL